MQTIRIRLPIFACVLCSLLSGCKTDYSLELKSGVHGRPAVDAEVVVTSAPRFHSFIDPRHYLVGCGESITVVGQTDSQGKVKVSLPNDLPIWTVCLDGKWWIQDPSSLWLPMLTENEFKEGTLAADLQASQDRPYIRRSPE